MRVSFRAHEVEHSGDLDRIEDAIRLSGGIVLKSVPDYDDESAFFVVELHTLKPETFFARLDSCNVCV